MPSIDSNKLHHAILGAGGVGGTLGTCLASEGARVTLVVRREKIAEYPKHIRLESPFGKFEADVAIAGEVPAADVLWIAVKATQLNEALSAIANPQSITAMVPLLNGIDHVVFLRSKYGTERIMPATIAGEFERVSAGHFAHRTPFASLNVSAAGRSLLGDTVDHLQKTGFNCRFIDNEPTLMWGKLVFLAPFALCTTAADKTVGEILASPEWRRLGEACVRESCAVGTAEGATVDADKVLAGVAGMPGSMRSSMQKDVENRRPPELDAIAGPILRGGEKHGIDIPATKRLATLVEQRAGVLRKLA